MDTFHKTNPKETRNQKPPTKKTQTSPRFSFVNPIVEETNKDPDPGNPISQE
eukprot:CAMPEP_0178919630 /NCGR_PEP_ID=MMETSP0786-20121207/14546_1 /TAXON_ID=186022 /ORGANISM="Thalassionema frauenfeldii, Strain CCMP 1798" /LENGTH=51 /DNA_ID=CAMNT_0020593587 /DNA_START=746 /DNA_END=901 /DNA_ORIENTATION=-